MRSVSGDRRPAPASAVRIEMVAGPEVAPAFGELMLRTALVAYDHIFPPEAPTPTVELLTERWARWLGSNRPAGQEGFVALDDSEVVGCVLARPAVGDRVGHLAGLYVAPERWTQGIGRALHDAGVAHLTGLGLPAATLWVLEGNHRARHWYESLGWLPTGARQVVFAPGGIDEVGYRLDL